MHKVFGFLFLVVPLYSTVISFCPFHRPLSVLLPLVSFQEPQVEEDDEDDDDEEEEEEEKAPNPPMMVPMADMLNHVSNHNANLEFTPVRGHIHCLY